MKFRFFISAALIILIIVSAGFLIRPKDERALFLDHKAGLVMREIGHNLLLKAGDTTSRVLPVRRIDKNIFQLEFESPFHFVPDTLKNIVNSSLQAEALPLSYLVNVRDCKTDDIVYGFLIGDGRNIVPCGGRQQPTSCYSIQLVFSPLDSTSDGRSYLPWMLSALIIGIIGLVFAAKTMINKNSSTGVSEDLLRVGRYDFSTDKQILFHRNEVIQLSDKESRILEILINHQNQLIQRERLLKEIWEDEGVVVVGRSLDVFISKLRKKLRHDTSIRIVNIHGRGYKLEA